ncbi:MAG TPA: type II toxin-antitoxin system VapC family toxin [Aquificales bacterium]|nr:type II toxin-antitoxin system VapC family toxin [Aquificales bacterium]
MKVLDTSVVFRLFDENAEHDLKEEIKQILFNERIFIPCEVIVELSYLLRTRLKKSKPEVVEIVSWLFLRENVELEPECLSALSLWKNSTLDKLVDALIIVKSKKRNCLLVTLDEEMFKVYSEI